MLAVPQAHPVSFYEILVGHHAHLIRQHCRDTTDMPCDARHQRTGQPVPPGHDVGDHVVVVPDRERHAVELRLDDPSDLVWQHPHLAGHPVEERLHLGAVNGVVEREHRNPVGSLAVNLPADHLLQEVVRLALAVLLCRTPECPDASVVSGIVHKLGAVTRVVGRSSRAELAGQG